MGDVVDLKPREEPPATDFWFAHLDLRLGRIETVITRLARQVWLVMCAVLALTLATLVSQIAG